jgi:DNA-binding transcriptional ArsR family regulator
MQEARLFQALSDGTRLRILGLLAGGPLNVSMLVGRLSCAQPAVSRHLRVLREADLIHDTRRGTEVEYRRDHDRLDAAMAFLAGLAGKPNQRKKVSRPGKGKRSQAAKSRAARPTRRAATEARTAKAARRAPDDLDDFLL